MSDTTVSTPAPMPVNAVNVITTPPTPPAAPPVTTRLTESAPSNDAPSSEMPSQSETPSSNAPSSVTVLCAILKDGIEKLRTDIEEKLPRPNYRSQQDLIASAEAHAIIRVFTAIYDAIAADEFHAPDILSVVKAECERPFSYMMPPADVDSTDSTDSTE